MKRLIAIATAVVALSPATANAQGLDLSCQFALTRLDHTTTNVLALDTNAVYWSTHYVAVPGSRIRIEGEFPYARYISWNVYDAAGRPIDALSDVQLRPDPGSSNPFLPGADRFATPRTYTAWIEFGPRPANPAPNTLYTGDSPTGQVWYRVYVPDRGRDAKGGTPLPKVSLHGAAPVGLDQCRETQAPYLPTPSGPALPDPTDDGNGYPGRNPPNWRLFENLCGSAIDILLDNEDGEAFHPDARGRCGDGPGFFANRDIAYVFTGTSRGFGELLVLRGRAPSFANTRPGRRRMPSGKQLRYFSICQYEPATQRVIDCAADDRVPVRRDGRFKVVVSTPEQRPRNARRRCGVGWIAWGSQPQGLLIYRHMLAAPGFAQAIQNVPAPGRERAVMRGYYPSGRYLEDKAAFERRGCARG
jgi:hypothetical protein